MSHDCCVVFVTAPDQDQARNIADAVLNARLAACVNIVPQLRSLYWWEGKIQDDTEVLCIMKTTRDKFAALAEAVRAAHSYEVPEIIALPIVDGHEPYMKWIHENVI